MDVESSGDPELSKEGLRRQLFTSLRSSGILDSLKVKPL